MWQKFIDILINGDYCEKNSKNDDFAFLNAFIE